MKRPCGFRWIVPPWMIGWIVLAVQAVAANPQEMSIEHMHEKTPAMSQRMPMMQQMLRQSMMMQMHMMFCPMREPGVQVEVKSVRDGVQITLQSKDPKVVERIQKKAEIMRLMHELMQSMPMLTPSEEKTESPPQH